MEGIDIYQDIARRTDGDIYIGVVGPVRTGKSTLIKRFMETLVLPNIQNSFRRDRATDELPQSAAGKTIMTTEPKFIPEEAVRVTIGDNAVMNVRMIDCVGYIVPSSLGYIENDNPRMVMTPWFDREIPFNMAAEIGTRKVITEHSTIGLVVTTDGSISDIPREEYEEAERRVIGELQEIGKPFVVLLNSVYPSSQPVQQMARDMAKEYGVPVIPISCLELTEEDIKDILGKILLQFPIREMKIDLPRWILSLGKDHWLKKQCFGAIYTACEKMDRISHLKECLEELGQCEHIRSAVLDGVDLGQGSARVCLTVENNLFYQILGEATGLPLEGEESLLPCMVELAAVKREYDRLKGALEEVEATGYGIVMPTMEELSLEEPEIMKQGGRYGVRLRASAPSIHLMRANITAEVAPIVGSEKQSEDLVMYLLNEFEENPQKIWESNIFGKSLHELVNEGLHNKLYRMPSEARIRLQETLERIINEGCSGLVCIIL